MYIPPDTDAKVAAEVVQNTVLDMDTFSPDSPKLILGDVNHCNLDHVLPNFEKCIYKHMFMDYHGQHSLSMFCSVPDSYKSLIRIGIGNSDHSVIHLLPKYRQKLKSMKTEVKEVKVWDETAIQKLQDCFELTDWDMFF